MHLFFALAIAVASFFRLHTADGSGPPGHQVPAPAVHPLCTSDGSGPPGCY